MPSKLKTLSIVLPCHNEQEVISASWEELTGILVPLLNNVISDYELIMVNNGSIDNTLDAMLKLQELDPKIKIVDLRNNFGYQGSITAGLYHANNDMIITIDADLQDDPSKIEEMVERYYDGYDLVLGVRKDRKTDSFFKRFTANAFYKISNLVGLKTVPHHGDFRLMSKELLEDFKKYEEKNRYIRGLILSLESRYAIVEYSRRERQAGETKFKPLKLIELALEGITSFSTAPIRLITITGFILFTLSLFSMLFILYQKFFGSIEVEGWAFLALAISLFGGLNSLFIGIIGEYLGKNYMESKNRPMFIVRKIYASEE
ncbi:MAG TPA: glycosyltransferase [Crocinitomix sp.]|nr:glycosyltransferase [Crocinitomix sp.]